MADQEAQDYQRVELVFQLLHGFVDVGIKRDVLAEDRKRISTLTDTIYCHRLKLCNRAGLDFEDRDLEGIINAYEQMNHLVARLMYDQGRLEGRQLAQE